MKKFIVGVLVAGSVLLVGCAKTPGGENAATSEKTTTENENVFKGTAKDLFKKGENVICTFSFEDQDTKEEGTIYIKDQKMKSDAKVFLKKENMNMEAFTVSKDGYTYTRSNIQKSQGAKFKLDLTNTEKNTEDPLDQKEIDFKCEEKSADDSIFTVPTDVNFIDISDYLKK